MSDIPAKPASVGIVYPRTGRQMRCSVAAFENVHRSRGWEIIPNTERPAEMAKPDEPEDQADDDAGETPAPAKKAAKKAPAKKPAETE